MAERFQRRGRFRELRGAIRPTGAVIAGIGIAQIATAAAASAVDAWWHTVGPREPMDALWLGVGGIATLFLGVALFMFGRRFSINTLNRREALLSVVLIWVTAGVFGGLPFMYAAELDFASAFFETTSGFTTTGATVFSHIERDLSTSLLLWRATIQWLGGMGIVVLFVAIFPSFGAGAKHLFKGEVPGATSEGLKPRIAETAWVLWQIYAAITALEAILLIVVGIDPFEAVCHAFTTMSTGGFSTRDASIAAFENPAAEYIIAIFMLLGSLNFALYYAMFRHRSVAAFWRSIEFRVFVAGVAAAIVAVTVGIYELHDHDPEAAFRAALFQVGTFVSSTGYLSDDYMAYPSPVLAILLALMFVGGCSGSTAGGLKWERLVLLTKMSWLEFHKSFRPALVRVVRMGRSAVSSEILTDVCVFAVVYVAVWAMAVFALTVVEGVPFQTAFGATLTCLANSGPSPFYEDIDNFERYSPIAKTLLALVMLLGRLELFTIFALFVPDFWRR